MRLLQEECETSKLSAAFAEKKGYQKIRRRLLTITQYKPYKKTAAAGTVLSVLLLAACSAALIQQHSYGRYETVTAFLSMSTIQRSRMQEFLHTHPNLHKAADSKTTRQTAADCAR